MEKSIALDMFPDILPVPSLHSYIITTSVVLNVSDQDIHQYPEIVFIEEMLL